MIADMPKHSPNGRWAIRSVCERGIPSGRYLSGMDPIFFSEGLHRAVRFSSLADAKAYAIRAFGETGSHEIVRVYGIKGNRILGATRLWTR